MGLRSFSPAQIDWKPGPARVSPSIMFTLSCITLTWSRRHGPGAPGGGETSAELAALELSSGSREAGRGQSGRPAGRVFFAMVKMNYKDIAA